MRKTAELARISYLKYLRGCVKEAEKDAKGLIRIENSNTYKRFPRSMKIRRATARERVGTSKLRYFLESRTFKQ